MVLAFAKFDRDYHDTVANDDITVLQSTLDIRFCNIN